MRAPIAKPATYQDLLALPPNVVGEIIAGELLAQPRPGTRHANAASALGEELGPPFRRGRGGPGGWIFLDEPELHFGEDVVVPDLAGWRRSRMPELPDLPYLDLAPDWICEVLSPSTVRVDRVLKRRRNAQGRGSPTTGCWIPSPRPSKWSDSTVTRIGSFSRRPTTTSCGRNHSTRLRSTCRCSGGDSVTLRSWVVSVENERIGGRGVLRTAGTKPTRQTKGESPTRRAKQIDVQARGAVHEGCDPANTHNTPAVSIVVCPRVHTWGDLKRPPGITCASVGITSRRNGGVAFECVLSAVGRESYARVEPR